MGINWTRVLLGGVVAGAILVGCSALIGFAVDANLAPWMEQVVQTPSLFAGGLTPVGMALDLILGIWAIWLYASMRPRYSQGPGTAICAGLATWFLIALVASSLSFFDGDPIRPGLIGLGFYLLAVLVATLVGAALYTEDEEGELAPIMKKSPIPTKRSVQAKAAAAKVPVAATPAPDQASPAKASPPAAPPAARPKAPEPAAPTAAPLPSAPPPPQRTAAPGGASIEEKRQELQESMVALELNDEVAVREVLRAFGGEGSLTQNEIIDHLTSVGWNFGGVHPRVAVIKALDNLVAQGGATLVDGRYSFSR